MNPQITEYIGYSASFFVVLSFLLKDIKKIRVINLLGCVCFVMYGIFAGKLWPIIIPNTILCFVQIYHIVKGK